ncbi:GCG_CRPN prefix-to-repeats domain-containing protein [Methylobacterium sp. JK268]
MRWTIAGAAVLTLGTLVGTAGVAEARDGCGPGFHRNFYGFCRPNFFGPRVVYAPVVYGPRWHRVGWYRPWHRVGWYGGWHRPYWHRVGWAPRPWGWHGGWHHAGWYHRW